MNIQTILIISGGVSLLIVTPIIVNLVQKQRIYGTFIKVHNPHLDDLYASIVMSVGEEEKEILIYKSSLARIQEGQYISVMKRKFESIYSLNFIIGEK